MTCSKWATVAEGNRRSRHELMATEITVEGAGMWDVKCVLTGIRSWATGEKGSKAGASSRMVLPLSGQQSLEPVLLRGL